ncbi:MAG: hypothetical protein ACYC2O_12485 [Microthrixaceae bacterium]
MSVRRGGRGAVSLTVVLVLVVVAVAATGVVRVGDAALRRARVEAVADLTALAAVEGGPEAASAVATASGAHVVSVVAEPAGRVTIVVERAGVTARAAAAPLGDPVGGTGRR